MSEIGKKSSERRVAQLFYHDLTPQQKMRRDRECHIDSRNFKQLINNKPRRKSKTH